MLSDDTIDTGIGSQAMPPVNTFSSMAALTILHYIAAAGLTVGDHGLSRGVSQTLICEREVTYLAVSRCIRTHMTLQPSLNRAHGGMAGQAVIAARAV